MANENADLERQGCNPFYSELFDDTYVNTVNFTASLGPRIFCVNVFLLKFMSLFQFRVHLLLVVSV